MNANAKVSGILQLCLNRVIQEMQLENLGKFSATIDNNGDIEITFFSYIFDGVVDGNGIVIAHITKDGFKLYFDADNEKLMKSNNAAMLKGKVAGIVDKFIIEVKKKIK